MNPDSYRMTAVKTEIIITEIIIYKPIPVRKGANTRGHSCGW